MDDDDIILLAGVRDGSHLAFNRLVDRHQRALRGFLRGMTSGPDDADDLAQETFLTVWRRADSYAGRGSVRSWIFSIAWRKLIDWRRGWLRGRRRDTEYLQARHDQAHDPVSAEDLAALHQALASLSMDQKAVVMLCVGSGFSHGEAAQVLGMPLGTVKSHALRGCERLRDQFGAEA